MHLFTWLEVLIITRSFLLWALPNGNELYDLGPVSYVFGQILLPLFRSTFLAMVSCSGVSLVLFTYMSGLTADSRLSEGGTVT